MYSLRLYIYLQLQYNQMVSFAKCSPKLMGCRWKVKEPLLFLVCFERYLDPQSLFRQ